MYNVIFLFYRQRMSYTVLHSVSLLDYYPNGIGGVQYLSITNVIVIAGWSDDKGTVVINEHVIHLKLIFFRFSIGQLLEVNQ